MNDSEAIKRDGEYPLYDAVKDLSKDDVESIVRKNAAEKYFVVKGEHLKVINTLIDHYKKSTIIKKPASQRTVWPPMNICVFSKTHMRIKAAVNIFICSLPVYQIARAYFLRSMNWLGYQACVCKQTKGLELPSNFMQPTHVLSCR